MISGPIHNNNNKRQIRRGGGFPLTVRGPCPREFYAYIILYYIVIKNNPANWSDVENKNLHIIIKSDGTCISRITIVMIIIGILLRCNHGT